MLWSEQLRSAFASGPGTLPELVNASAAPLSDTPDREAVYLTDAEFRERERLNIQAVLRHSRGQVWGEKGAAALLGIKASTLNHRMKMYGLKKDKHPGC